MTSESRAVLCRGSGLSKTFRRRVLADLDIEVRATEIVALSGPSGSGKSTLLNILGLLETADAGALTLFGEPAPRPGSRGAMVLRRHRIGYLFQNFALVSHDTVEANLRLAQRYAEGSAQAQRTARVAALERVGLPGMGAARVFELSGGEQQRVALARLLVKPKELVLADEPTGSLDTGNRDSVLDLLRHLASTGSGVVIVSHDEHVCAAADRVVFLDPARIRSAS